MRLALVTCDALSSLFGDEQALPAHFTGAGCDVTVASWSDPQLDWRRFDRVLLRSTWDYVPRIVEFRRWLDHLDRLRIPLCNPLPLVRWNLDKVYLRELERQGIPIVPTQFIAKGAVLDLASLVTGEPMILKPSISGSAYRTHRFAAVDARSLQAELDGILATGGALLQPFAPEIVSEGEWSLLFFGGALSHAVLKTPAPGDFRVQLEHGGASRVVTPLSSMIDSAQRVVDCLPFPAAYARIDGVRRGERFLLMEAEVIEPYLFMADAPGAIERFVAAVLA